MRLRVLLSIAAVAAAACAGGCLSAVYAIGFHDYNKELIAARQARVELSGTVRDADGRPLRDVRVSYTRTYLTAPWSEIARDEHVARGSRTVNERFHFDFDPAQSVRLVFEKDGCAPAERSFAVRPTTTPSTPESGPPASPVREADLVVTLR